MAIVARELAVGLDGAGNLELDFTFYQLVPKLARLNHHRLPVAGYLFALAPEYDFEGARARLIRSAADESDEMRLQGDWE